MSNVKNIKQEQEVATWLNKISQAEKVYGDYHDLIRNIRKYYRNETRKDKVCLFF